ncbi:GTP cyclohydrolase II RibA [Rhizobiales bacterium RZME27]|jgi:GTP cyclohydrolase II|uniref:GTP cyclohydrolase-2 n=1 Tax=Endobacterium cereale TaxID=2663029 RepID=A0A6A8AH00_9HYPH|nr:GTP cyclohydrolase II RibA [Endobacterium cereale]MEB2847211.1 GTP cyclohydrolase II RibA [Endobacterium cereale]MQY49060.1 GTP cyclohydrolase II RibA [Endobacterium cereale]
MTASSSAYPMFDASEASIVRERAVSELRYGRPVLLMHGNLQYAVVSLDTATPEILSRFGDIAANRQELFITAQRAQKLGITAPYGALINVSDTDYEQLATIAYGFDTTANPSYRSASESLAKLEILARSALLLPAFMVFEIASSDHRFDGCVMLDAATLEHDSVAEAHFSIVARTQVPLKGIDTAEFVVFRGGVAQRDQIAIVVGSPDMSKPVPVRIHSSCITGDLFGSLKCDCGDQLRKGMQLIEQRGGGILLYLDQEGRGTGIASKMRAYGYQTAGLDTVDADATLGFGDDGRAYGAAVAMLRGLGVSSVELLTNNPRKIAAIENAGFTVRHRTPVLGLVTEENRGYLRTKVRRSGHMIDIESLKIPAE